MDNSIFSLIDILVLGCGFYALYSAYMLQKDGTIIRTFLVQKDTDLTSCKDLQGYANYMSPKLYMLGTVMIINGLVSLINTYVVTIETLFWVMMAVFLGVLVWYGLQTRKAMEKFF